MLLPFIAWSLTAVFFLLRPGYDQAYESPQIHYYEWVSPYTIPTNAQWLEARYFRSVLGEHLIVKRDDGWHHLHADSLAEWPLPEEDELSVLMQEAISSNPERYGVLTEVVGTDAVTNTGVNLSLNWNTLSIRQEGRDTRWIDRIYSIHYLQWTGFGLLDKILGLVGLLLLMCTTYTGARLVFKLNHKPKIFD